MSRALADNALLRYATFTALYVAQGLPHGFLTIAIPGWLVADGRTSAEVGWYLGTVTFPLGLKFLLGPLMDRFTFLPMGRRRPWVIVGQLGLLATTLAFVVLPSAGTPLMWLAVCGFTATLFAAVQDVGVDGMAIDILPDGDRTRANGLMFGGRVLGVAAAAAAGGWLLSAHGLATGAVAVALCLAMIALLPLVLRERPGERLLPWTAGKASVEAQGLQLSGWRQIFGNLVRSLFLPSSIAAGVMIFVFRAGEGLLRAVLPVLAVSHLQWTNPEYAALMGTAGLVAGVAGMVLAATVVEYIGRLRTVVIANVLLVLLHVGAALFPHWLESRAVFATYAVATQVLDVTVAVAILTVFMGLCWKAIAATQFTIYLSLANLGYSAGAALLGPLDERLSLAGMLFVLAAFSVLAMAAVPFIRLQDHEQRLQALG